MKRNNFKREDSAQIGGKPKKQKLGRLDYNLSHFIKRISDVWIYQLLKKQELLTAKNTNIRIFSA